MLTVIRPKDRSQIAVVTWSWRCKWGQSEQCKAEVSRRFWSKRRECQKDRINGLATNSNNKNIRDLYRGINEFKRGYQPRSNSVKEENGDLLADSHNILNRCKKYRVSTVKSPDLILFPGSKE
jgi:hypothetical protein